MDWFIRWHEAHTLAFELILFLCACLVSVFSTKIYQFVTQWPRRTAGTIVTRRMEFELLRLERLHNNVYNLFIYLLRETVVTAFAVLFIILIVCALLLYTRQKLIIVPFYGTITGLIVGRLYDFYQLVEGLYSYKDTVKGLQDALAAKRTTAAQAGK